MTLTDISDNQEEESDNVGGRKVSWKKCWPCYWIAKVHVLPAFFDLWESSKLLGAQINLL